MWPGSSESSSTREAAYSGHGGTLAAQRLTSGSGSSGELEHHHLAVSDQPDLHVMICRPLNSETAGWLRQMRAFRVPEEPGRDRSREAGGRSRTLSGTPDVGTYADMAFTSTSTSSHPALYSRLSLIHI